MQCNVPVLFLTEHHAYWGSGGTALTLALYGGGWSASQKLEITWKN